MQISVIIPTYNGAARISVLLRALRAQSRKPNEIVVVVDGSTDNTTAKLEEHADLNIKVIVIPNSGRAQARNAGVAASTGSLLVFYDDDMEPAIDSIAQHEAIHNTFTQTILLGGNQIEEESASKSDIQNYKASRVKFWLSKYQAGLNKASVDNLYFTAANCSMARALFDKLNGFDARLTDAEDYDLGYRALELGIDVYFDKSNIAIHHDAVTCISYIKRIRQYQLAHQRLLKLHGERKLDSVQPNRVKKIIYRLLAQPWLPWSIDKNFFKIVLPKNLRYKFYSAVIYALGVEKPSVKL